MGRRSAGAIAALLLAATSLSIAGCAASERVRASIYQGLATRDCRMREGDDYPAMSPCPQGDFQAYDEERQRHLEEIRDEPEMGAADAPPRP